MPLNGFALGTLADFLSFTAEDNMNVQLKDITVTARDGRVSHLDQVYIRGSHVRFFIVPDMLKFVPNPLHSPSSPAGFCMVANMFQLGTRPCSEVAMPEVVVSVWLEDAQRSAEPEPVVVVADKGTTILMALEAKKHEYKIYLGAHRRFLRREKKPKRNQNY